MFPVEAFRNTLLKLSNILRDNGIRFHLTGGVTGAASKLVWINKGSHKSRRDLRAIYRGCNADQKRAIEKQAEQLGLRDLLSQVLTEPNELQ